MGILAKLTGKKPENEQPTSKTKSTASYRGVQIVPGSEGCCKEATDISSHRYLPHEIPRIPLESCDFGNCQCKYKLFDDRRTDLRRASDVGFDWQSSLRTEVDQRSNDGDRRKAR